MNAVLSAVRHVASWMTDAPRAQTAVAVLRIVVGVLGLVYYLRDYRQRHLFLGPDGVYGNTAINTITADLGTFNVYGVSDSLAYFEVVFHLGIAAALAMTLGFGGRFTIALHYVLLWSIFGQNPALLDGGDNLQMIVVPALLLTRCMTRLSVVRRRPGAGEPGVAVSVLHNTGVLVIAVQICIVYLMSGLYKVQGQMWQDGTALYYILRVPEFYFPGVTEMLFASDVVLVLAAYGTVLSSVFFPVLVLFRRGRLPAVLIMTAFHLGIAFVMGLTSFAAIMIACDLLFVNHHVERVLAGAGQRVRRAWAALGYSRPALVQMPTASSETQA